MTGILEPLAGTAPAVWESLDDRFAGIRGDSLLERLWTGGRWLEGPVYSPESGSWEMGLPVTPVGDAAWDTGESLVFKFVMTLDPATPDSQQNSSLGISTIVWEARNG